MLPRAVAEFTRFKDSYSKAIRRAVLVAAAFHLLLFVLAPPFNFKPYEVNAETVVEIVDIPPEIVIPSPPKEVPLPPTNITPSNDPDASDETPETTFESWDDIPPPPTNFACQSGSFRLMNSRSFYPLINRPTRSWRVRQALKAGSFL